MRGPTQIDVTHTNTFRREWQTYVHSQRVTPWIFNIVPAGLNARNKTSSLPPTENIKSIAVIYQLA
jgi:hypothetical protein